MVEGTATLVGRRGARSGRRRRVTAVIGTLLAAVLVTACSSGSGNASAPSSVSLPPTTSTTSTGAAPSPSDSYAPADPKRIGTTVTVTGPSGTLTAEQKSVLDVWTRYWRLAMATFNSQGAVVAPDFTKVDAVAMGEASLYVVDGGAYRSKKGMYTVGSVTLVVSAVDVRSGNATVRGCLHDESYEIDSKGATVIPAPGASAVADEVTRTPEGWRVSKRPEGLGACRSGS